jgi:hypothetical protein
MSTKSRASIEARLFYFPPLRSRTILVAERLVLNAVEVSRSAPLPHDLVTEPVEVVVWLHRSLLTDHRLLPPLPHDCIVWHSYRTIASCGSIVLVTEHSRSTDAWFTYLQHRILLRYLFRFPSKFRFYIMFS